MSGPVKRGKVRPEFADFALPKYRKAKKSKPKASTPEAVIQRQVENYCALVHLECFHIPEIMLAVFKRKEGRTGAELGALHDAAEMVKGWPDCSISDPRYHGYTLYLELKTEIGKMSPYQKRWLRVLGTKVPRSFDAARADIDAWRAWLKIKEAEGKNVNPISPLETLDKTQDYKPN